MKHLYHARDILTFMGTCSRFAKHHYRARLNISQARFSSWRSFTLRKPMSQLMQAESGGGLQGCKVGDNWLSQVKSAKQPTDFSLTYIFIWVAVHCHRTAAVSPPFNFTSSFLTPIRKVHFPCPISLKVSLAISHSARCTSVFPICILKGKTDMGGMVLARFYDPTKSTRWKMMLKHWFKGSCPLPQENTVKHDDGAWGVMFVNVI